MTHILREVWHTLGAQGRAPFLVTPSQKMSYRELLAWIEDICGLFDEHGLDQRSTITIAVSDDAAACAIFLAALLDGIVPVMLSAEAHTDRVAAISRTVSSKLHFDDNMKTTPPNLRSLNAFRRTERRGRCPRLPTADDNALACILFTSGSTTAPRGVKITYKNLSSQLKTMERLFTLGAGSRIFNVSPISHTDGLVQGPLLSVAVGASLLRPGGFRITEVEAWFDFLRAEDPTHMIANPTLLSLLLNFALESDLFNLDRFHGVICTGGVLSEDLWSRFEARFGVKVFNVYGMTETVANALFAGDHSEMGKRGTIGRPVDCKARISEPGLVGDLELKGENISPGYWEMPSMNAAGYTSDGWFRTGDVVRTLSDGSFEFLGRSNSVINQGAVRIYPEEIDEAIMSHPSVIESMTFSFPDPEFEEIAISAVTTSSRLDSLELHAVCTSLLEPLRRPKIIRIVDMMPRTSTGKIDRTILAELFDLNGESKPSAKHGNIEEKIFGLMAKVFSISSDKLSLRSVPDEIPGWDSFNHVQMIMEVETALGIELTTREIISIRSVQTLVQIAKSHLERFA